MKVDFKITTSSLAALTKGTVPYNLSRLHR